MSLKPKTAVTGSPAAKFAATVLKLETKANAIKVTPGHGVAGRHATRELLDACPATKIPACSAGCSRRLPPLNVSDAKLQALADAMIDPESRRSGRQQPEHSGRLHLFRTVRRP